MYCAHLSASNLAVQPIRTARQPNLRNKQVLYMCQPGLSCVELTFVSNLNLVVPIGRVVMPPTDKGRSMSPGTREYVERNTIGGVIGNELEWYDLAVLAIVLRSVLCPAGVE